MASDGNNQPRPGCSIAPLLSVRQAARAIEFYRLAFGAVETHHVEDFDGAIIAGPSVNGAEFWVADGLDEVSRGRFVLDRMEHLHPGVTDHFEVSASYSWVGDPWARGASAEFRPRQLSRFYQTLREPEGRIYFAGEYNSAWSGWINGALESGERIAAAIASR